TLKGKVIAEASFVTGIDWLPPEDANDYLGHGTACASIIAGTGEPGGAVWDLYYSGDIIGWVAPGTNVGMAPSAVLLNAKAFCSYGFAFWDWILKAIEWSVEHGADILSCSFGGPQYPPELDPERIAIEWAVSNGVVVVCAAGNAGPYLWTGGAPAAELGAIAVGSLSEALRISDYSSRGPTVHTMMSFPDVLAPAEGTVMACDWLGYWTRPPAECVYWITWGGTSFAAPHVAGAVALLLQAFPGATPAAIEIALRRGAWKLINPVTGEPYDHNIQGSGVINVTAAYYMLEEAPKMTRAIPAPTETIPAKPGPVPYESPVVTIEKTYPCLIESPHPYYNDMYEVYTLTHPGAKAISVHFEKIDVEDYCDYVYIYDADWNLIAVYTGYYEDIWTPWVPGDTVYIVLESDFSITYWGFRADKYAIDYVRKVTKVWFDFSEANILVWSHPYYTAYEQFMSYFSVLSADGANVVFSGETPIRWNATSACVPMVVESPHPYPTDWYHEWNITCPPGVECDRIRIHFVYIDVEDYWDWIYVYDENYTLIEAFTGYYEDLWVEVPGCKAIVALYSDPWIAYDGFVIDQIECVKVEETTYSGLPVIYMPCYNLTEFNILIIPDPLHYDPLTLPIEDVVTFVEHGGNLLVIGDNLAGGYVVGYDVYGFPIYYKNVTEANIFTEHWGITWSDVVGGGYSMAVNTTHPIANYTTTLYDRTWSIIADELFTCPKASLVVSEPAVTVAWDPHFPTVAAWSDTGKVVVVADDFILSDEGLNAADNLVLGELIIRWFLDAPLRLARGAYGMKVLVDCTLRSYDPYYYEIMFDPERGDYYYRYVCVTEKHYSMLWSELYEQGYRIFFRYPFFTLEYDPRGPEFYRVVYFHKDDMGNWWYTYRFEELMQYDIFVLPGPLWCEDERYIDYTDPLFLYTPFYGMVADREAIYESLASVLPDYVYYGGRLLFLGSGHMVADMSTGYVNLNYTEFTGAFGIVWQDIFGDVDVMGYTENVTDWFITNATVAQRDYIRDVDRLFVHWFHANMTLRTDINPTLMAVAWLNGTFARWHPVNGTWYETGYWPIVVDGLYGKGKVVVVVDYYMFRDPCWYPGGWAPGITVPENDMLAHNIFKYFLYVDDIARRADLAVEISYPTYTEPCHNVTIIVTITNLGTYNGSIDAVHIRAYRLSDGELIFSNDTVYAEKPWLVPGQSITLEFTFHANSTLAFDRIHLVVWVDAYWIAPDTARFWEATQNNVAFTGWCRPEWWIYLWPPYGQLTPFWCYPDITVINKTPREGDSPLLTAVLPEEGYNEYSAPYVAKFPGDFNMFTADIATSRDLYDARLVIEGNVSEIASFATISPIVPPLTPCHTGFNLFGYMWTAMGDEYYLGYVPALPGHAEAPVLICIPEDAEPGLYTGYIALYDGEELVATMPLAFRVEEPLGKVLYDDIYGWWWLEYEYFWLWVYAARSGFDLDPLWYTLTRWWLTDIYMIVETAHPWEIVPSIVNSWNTMLAGYCALIEANPWAWPDWWLWYADLTDLQYGSCFPTFAYANYWNMTAAIVEDGGGLLILSGFYPYTPNDFIPEWAYEHAHFLTTYPFRFVDWNISDSQLFDHEINAGVEALPGFQILGRYVGAVPFIWVNCTSLELADWAVGMPTIVAMGINDILPYAPSVTPPGSFGPAVVTVEKLVFGPNVVKRVVLVSGSAQFLPEVLEYGDWYTFIMAWLFGVSDPGFGTPSHNYPWTIETWTGNLLSYLCTVKSNMPPTIESLTPEAGAVVTPGEEVRVAVKAVDDMTGTTDITVTGYIVYYCCGNYIFICTLDFTYDPATETYVATWKPLPGVESGTYVVFVTATDITGFSTEATTWFVVNYPPQITKAEVEPSSLYINETALVKIEAYDPEDYYELTVTIRVLTPEGTWMDLSVFGENGRWSAYFTATTVGAYKVYAYVTDTLGTTTSLLVGVVECVSRAPSLRPGGSPVISPIVVTQGEKVTIGFTASDPDGELLTAEIRIVRPDGKVDVVVLTGYGPEWTYVYSTEGKPIGTYEVYVTVTDPHGMASSLYLGSFHVEPKPSMLAKAAPYSGLSGTVLGAAAVALAAASLIKRRSS
ncbi:hypothetical protein B6U66_02840, partial [Candidatus Bathyarchaeota archaeon ex4484_135]